jgi:hypothetical protein
MTLTEQSNFVGGLVNDYGKAPHKNSSVLILHFQPRKNSGHCFNYKIRIPTLICKRLLKILPRRISRSWANRLLVSAISRIGVRSFSFAEMLHTLE